MAVSYTHLDVYKRQGLADPNSDSSIQSYANIYDQNWLMKGNVMIAPGIERVEMCIRDRFYADMTTGAYQITGTADAGSKIIYGDDGASVNAGSDGTFTIPGTLDENSGVLSLCAQDLSLIHICLRP